MADKTVGELPRASTVTTTDLFVMEQAGQAKSLTGQVLINDLATALDGHGGIKSITLNDDYTLTFIMSDDTEVKTTSVRGATGAKGDKGTDGRAITSVTKISTSGLVDTYKISFYDVSVSLNRKTPWSNIVSKIRAAFKTTALPVDSGGTGATTADAARANLGALSNANGAVGTANLADKAVGVAQLTNDAHFGTELAISTPGSTPDLAWGNALVWVWGTSMTIKLTAAVSALLPPNWQTRIFANDPFTFEWEGIGTPVNVAKGQTESATGSIAVPAKKYIDLKKIDNNIWIFSGTYAERMIYAGTTEPFMPL